MSGPYRIAQSVDLSCDAVIIGSGAGGAAVADILTAAGLDVIMVEEGPYIAADKAPAQLTTAFRSMWRGGGLTAALGKTPVAYAEGRCVGGSTEINSAIFQEAPEEVVAQWRRDYRIAEFSEQALKPYYARAARAVNAAVASEPVGAATERMRAAGDAMGWRVATLERAHIKCVGTNMCTHGCPTGAKQSMTATLIPLALTRGMRLIADCRIDTLVVRKRRIAAVRGRALGADGRSHGVRIRSRQVFLCCGAIQTPALLRAHGYRHNIGNSLRLHPTIKAAVLFDQPLNAHQSALPQAAITEFMPQMRFGGSVFTPGTFGMFLAEDWERRGRHMASWRNAALYYAMVRGRGRGTIRNLPGKRTAPLVRYRLHESDWQGLAAGIGQLGRAMFAAGAIRVIPSVSGHEGWTEPGQCGEFGSHGLPPQRTSLMTIHLFGSAPLGEDDRRCATDSFGRLRGLENVVIADGSQVPAAPGTNPQATVMALAFRAAEAHLSEGAANPRRQALDESTRI